MIVSGMHVVLFFQPINYPPSNAHSYDPRVLTHADNSNQLHVIVYLYSNKTQVEQNKYNISQVQ